MTTVRSVVVERRRSPLRRFVAHFRHGDVVAGLALCFLVLIALAGVFAPSVLPNPNQQNLGTALEPPLARTDEGFHVLGTDELGRDLFARILWGIRPLSVVVVVSVLIAASVGLVYGLLAGFSKGYIGELAMRVADIQLSIPPIILAVLLAVVLEPGMRSSIASIALVTWPQYARVVRADTLRIRTSDYVQLARVAGLTGPQLVRHHVLRNVMNSFVVLCTLNLAIAIIISAALSFLGLGIQPPTPDWGSMLAGGTRYLQSWWLVVAPGAAISLTVLALNLIGDHLRDILDPRFNSVSIAMGGTET